VWLDLHNKITGPHDNRSVDLSRLKEKERGGTISFGKKIGAEGSAELASKQVRRRMVLPIGQRGVENFPHPEIF